MIVIIFLNKNNIEHFGKSDSTDCDKGYDSKCNSNKCR